MKIKKITLVQFLVQVVRLRKKHVGLVRLGLVWFYNISTLVGYLMPNLGDIYIYIYIYM